MMRVSRYIALSVLAMMIAGGSAFAQSGPTWHPGPPEGPIDFFLGQSYCLEFPPFPPPSSDSFFLVGDPDGGPANVPILLMEAGCDQAATNCDWDCEPIEPPPTELVYGGDPQGFYPDWWYTGNDCFQILIRFAGDDCGGCWDMIITGFCAGCICITFEDQLAVELNEFTATPGDRQVSLSWSTASENQNDHFEILRDGDLVHRVDGNGTAAVGSNYSWIDTDVINGRTYEYELVSVEVGGSRHSLVSESVTPSATSGLVAEYALHQNFPNPFNPETSIAFDLAEAGDISLKVYNLTGQVIATVASGSHDAGRHVVNFDGSSLSAGVYFYALETGNFSAARKLVLLK